ncbi:MAG: DNA repair protein RecO [Cyclobacteriaceae bacterium]|nr:DNA repair protein RecO [Cyclobacteriaceae bacterium]
MLHKTRGVVLSFIKYKESSIIVKIFTENYGLQSYIVNAVRNSKSKNKIALFQPLTLVDMVVYKNPGRDIQRISELKCRKPFTSLPFSITKSAIAIFITELLVKTLHHEEENASLFAFLDDSVQKLDATAKGSENFHLYFMVNLCAYLGFNPETPAEFVSQIGEYWPQEKPEMKLLKMIMEKWDETVTVDADRNARNNLLSAMVKYYKIHHMISTEFKSIQVLKESLA